MALLAVLATTAALAQTGDNYPNRPVRLLVPYAAGGGTDVAARNMANAVSKVLGQPIVIDNRPGASGALARSELTRSAPNGYTFMVDAVGTLVASSLVEKKHFEPGRDFVAVGSIAHLPFFLAVRNDMPAKSLAELVALAKSKPGSLTYGSTGNGSEGHLVVKLLAEAAGVHMVHVPYKGGALAVTDLSAGTIDFVVLGLSTLRPAVDRKAARLLAVLSPARSPSAPDVPTSKESGYPAFTHVLTFGVFASANTPAAVVTKWNEALARAKNDKGFGAWADATGSEIYIADGRALDRQYKEEIRKWTPVVEKLEAETPR